jgi:hypothetical protein
VRRLLFAAVAAMLLTGCGTAVRTAKNPEPTSTPVKVRQAYVGDAISLSGVDEADGTTGRLKLAVKVSRIVPTARGQGAFENPRKGERFAAVRFVFKDIGDTMYRDSPTFGAKVIDASGHGYDPTVATVSAGPGFPRTLRLRHGQSRAGYIVFALPKTAQIVRVEYALNAGYAPEIGQWRIRPRPERTLLGTPAETSPPARPSGHPSYWHRPHWQPTWRHHG